MRVMRHLVFIYLLGAYAGNAYSADLSSADPAKAYFDALRERASKGDSDASVCLGEIYQRGIIVFPDPEQAYSLFKSAADAGNPRGKTQLAVLMSADTGSGKANPQAAMAMLKELVKEGYAPAATEIGVFYAAGVGVPADEDQARNWYMKGAAAGDPMAEVRLAIQDRLGDGVAKDPKAAQELLEKVSKQRIDCLPEYLYLVPFIINANFEQYDNKESSDSAASKGVFDFKYTYEDGKAVAISIVNATDHVKKLWLDASKVALLPPWPDSYVIVDKRAGFHINNAIQIELPNIPFQHYKEQVYKSIPASMLKNTPALLGATTVHFELKGTKPSAVRVTRSSGHQEVDDAAVRTVESAVYPMPPAGYENESFHLSLIINFNGSTPAPAGTSEGN